MIWGTMICLLLVSLGGVMAAAGTEGKQAAQNETNLTNNSVIISNFAFEPQELNVTVNSSVIWTNEDSAPHTIVTDKDAPSEIASKQFIKGETFVFNFTTAGTYPYHCGIHPSMKGIIQVNP